MTESGSRMCQTAHGKSKRRDIIQMLSGKGKRITCNQGGYHMNILHALFDELKQGYKEYVKIAYCEYRF